MKLDELQNVSMEIIDVFNKGKIDPSDCVEVMSFTIAKLLYAIGVKGSIVKAAISAVAQDIYDGYKIIDELTTQEVEAN